MHPLACDLCIRKPNGRFWIAVKLFCGTGFLSEDGCQPRAFGRHRLQCSARFFRQASAHAGIEPGDCHVALISAGMAGEWIDRDSNQATFSPDLPEECFVRGPDSGEATFFHSYSLFRAWVAHHGNIDGGVGNGVCLNRRTVRIFFNERHTRAMPDGDGFLRMKERHSADPVTTAAVPPKSPGNFSELRMTAFFAEIGQTFLKGLCRSVSRITPHLAICILGLLVGRREESAVVLFRQGLPVEIPGSGLPRFAGAFPATVLVNDDPTQPLHSFRNPDGVLHREDEVAGFFGLVAYAVVRRFNFGRLVVGRVLGRCRGGYGKRKNQKMEMLHEWIWFLTYNVDICRLTDSSPFSLLARCENRREVPRRVASSFRGAGCLRWAVDSLRQGLSRDHKFRSLPA